MLTDDAFILSDWEAADAETFAQVAAQWRHDGSLHFRCDALRPLYRNEIRYTMPQPQVIQDDHNRVAMVEPHGVKYHRIKPSVLGVTQCGQRAFSLAGVATEAPDDTPACKLCDL